MATNTTDKIRWSKRQRQVLDMLVAGKSNKEIAEALGVSLDGAKWHLREIFAKLGVGSREQAAEYWRKRGTGTRRALDSARALFASLPKWVVAASVGAAVAPASLAAFLLLTLGGARTSGTSTADATPDPEGEVVLELRWDSFQPGPPGMLRTVDPYTGQEIAGVPGTIAGQVASVIPSPDGELVAAIIHDSLSASASIHGITATTGQDRIVASDERVEGSASPNDVVVWAPDGSRFYFFTGETGHPMALFVADTATASARLLGDVDFKPMSPAVSPDGGTLFTLGTHTENDSLAHGSPLLAAIDTATGDVRSQIDLPGLLAGQLEVQAADGTADIAEYGPTLLLAPDGTTGYIVHAESNAISVVDLASMRVTGTTLAKQARSWATRLAGAIKHGFLDDASAKGSIMTLRSALLTAGGRYLWVAGENSEACESRPFCAPVPAGLRVIDTRDMSLAYSQDDVGIIALSPDGATVVASGDRMTFDNLGHLQASSGPGALLFDAQQPRVVAQLDKGTGFVRLSITTDGAVAVLQSTFRDDTLACHDSCARFTVVDVGARRVVQRRIVNARSPQEFGARNAP